MYKVVSFYIDEFSSRPILSISYIINENSSRYIDMLFDTGAEMPILCLSEKNNRYPFSMILSSTMFEGLTYTINTKKKKIHFELETASDLVRNVKRILPNGEMDIFSEN